MASAKSRFGCENGPSLRNKFRSPTPPSAKTPLGTRVPFRSTGTPFRSCEMAAKSPKREISNFRSHNPISQGVSQLRNTPLAHECHFAAQYPHFAAAKWAAKMAPGCENPISQPHSYPLPNPPFAMKMAVCCQMISKLLNGYEMISKLPNGYEMISKLRNGCEMISKL